MSVSGFGHRSEADDRARRIPDDDATPLLLSALGNRTANHVSIRSRGTHTYVQPGRQRPYLNVFGMRVLWPGFEWQEWSCSAAQDERSRLWRSSSLLSRLCSSSFTLFGFPPPLSSGFGPPKKLSTVMLWNEQPPRQRENPET